eukprot:TRINITY_DN3674_c0_g2_i4.p1 TRINITY_DN3674_c0_g2~~TRINITY_DN3674_c0_g2_i4.p1  ORF type:complete len:378 (+),score=46.49 TRINITY_DN3674_c0_g2_i4:105-1238(+)
MWVPNDRALKRNSLLQNGVIELESNTKPTVPGILKNGNKYLEVIPQLTDTQTKQPQNNNDVTSEQYSSTTRLMVALGYMGCAILLVFFNKAALSHYDFNHANIITLLQLTFALIMLIPLRIFRKVSFFKGEKEKEDEGLFVPWRVLIKVLPLSMAYLVYMVVGMASLRGVNLPMYTTLRRTTAAFTMVAEYLIMRKIHNSKVVTAVGMMVIGALIAGLRDLEFNLHGYLMVFAANCSTALYLAVISKIGSSSGLNSFGLIWCNSLMCAPILLIFAFFTGEIQLTLQFKFLHTIGFQITMMGSCLLAFLLNYFIFLNTQVNSALAQTVCGNLKDVFIIGFGYFTFGGVKFELFNFVGMMTGMLGSVYYAYLKLSGKGK